MLQIFVCLCAIVAFPYLLPSSNMSRVKKPILTIIVFPKQNKNFFLDSRIVSRHACLFSPNLHRDERRVSPNACHVCIAVCDCRLDRYLIPCKNAQYTHYSGLLHSIGSNHPGLGH